MDIPVYYRAKERNPKTVTKHIPCSYVKFY